MPDIILSIQNLRSIRQAEIRIAPLALLIGENEAGKTTCATALAALLTGQSDVWPATLKGDAKTLVNRLSGAKAAKVSLTHDSGSASLAWPDGRLETDGAFLQSSVYGAGLSSLCDMKPKERVLHLSAVLKPEPTKADWEAAFADVVMPEGSVEAMWAKVAKDGWDTTLQKAAERRSERVREWEAATGEEFGGKKTVDWKPDGLTPDLEVADETDLEQAVTVAKAQLEEGLRGAGASAGERSRLQALVDSLPELRDAFEKAETALQEAATAVSKAEKARAALPAVNEKGALKQFILGCPHCGAMVEAKVTPGDQGIGVAAVELLQSSADGEQTEPDKKTRLAIASADGALSTARAAHSTATANVGKASLALNEAEGAEKTLKTMKAPAQQTDLSWFRTEVTRTEGRLALYRRWREATDAAEFIGYSKRFVAALKPEGVRGKKLTESLDNFNGVVLADICQKADWPEVMVNPDEKDGLDIFYKGEPMARGSASAQWRCRVALQIAMATLSHDQMLVIDAADINDKDRRADLIGLLHETPIPTLVTMTAFPDQVPDLAALDPPYGHTYVILKDGNVVNIADIPAPQEDAEEEEPAA